MDKHQTENPAGKAIHHFKVVGLLGKTGSGISPPRQEMNCYASPPASRSSDRPGHDHKVSRAAAKHTTVAERKCTTEIMADDSDFGVATGTVGRRPWESYVPACSGADDAVASCRLPLRR